MGRPARQILLVDIGAGLEILGEVSSGVAGDAWTAVFTARGGLGVYSWAISSGAVPTGAAPTALDDTYTLAADPLSAGGYFTFSVRLTDTLLRRSVTRTFTVLVIASPVPTAYLNTEAGDRLTTESGDYLILES